MCIAPFDSGQIYDTTFSAAVTRRCIEFPATTKYVNENNKTNKEVRELNKKTNKPTLKMMLEKVLDEKEIAKTRERIIKSVKERRVKNED